MMRPLMDVKPFTYVVFDIETTGLDPHQGAMIEIGAVKCAGTEALGEYQTVLKPRVKIEPSAFLAHGISDEVAQATGREPGEGIRDFLSFVGDAVLVAHNGIGFDFPFLAVESARFGLPLKRNRLLDTLPLARKYLKTPDGSFRLQSLCDAYQIKNEQAHRALSDARATARVFHEVLRLCTILDDLWQCSYALEMDSILSMPEGFDMLRQAMDFGKDLFLEYESRGQPSRERWVRPRNLTIGVNGARCMKAICLEDNIEKHFRLDRIRRLISVGQFVQSSSEITPK